MSIFFISADVDGSNFKYMLDSTSKVQVDDTGKLTTHPIQTGAQVSDHYVNNNVRISFSGVVSDIKAVNNPAFRGRDDEAADSTTTARNQSTTVLDTDNSKIAATAQSYVQGLQDIKNRKIPFSIDVGNIGVFVNCMFTALSIRQTSKNGTAQGPGGDLDSFIISFSAEQIRFGDRAVVDIIRPEFVKTSVKEDIVDQETKAGVKKEVGTAGNAALQNLFDRGSLGLF